MLLSILNEEISTTENPRGSELNKLITFITYIHGQNPSPISFYAPHPTIFLATEEVPFTTFSLSVILGDKAKYRDYPSMIDRCFGDCMTITQSDDIEMRITITTKAPCIAQEKSDGIEFIFNLDQKREDQINSLKQLEELEQVQVQKPAPEATQSCNDNPVDSADLKYVKRVIIIKETGEDFDIKTEK